MQASAIQVWKRGVSKNRLLELLGPEHKVLRDNEVKLQSCSVETVEKFVKQRAKPM